MKIGKGARAGADGLRLHQENRGVQFGKAAFFAIQQCIHWLHSERMKDSGLRIRVQRELRDQFHEVCRAQDRSAAQVLREFMREYVARHTGAMPPAEPAGKPEMTELHQSAGEPRN